MIYTEPPDGSYDDIVYAFPKRTSGITVSSSICPRIYLFPQVIFSEI